MKIFLNYSHNCSDHIFILNLFKSENLGYWRVIVEEPQTLRPELPADCLLLHL